MYIIVHGLVKFTSSVYHSINDALKIDSENNHKTVCLRYLIQDLYGLKHGHSKRFGTKPLVYRIGRFTYLDEFWTLFCCSVELTFML